MLKHGTIVNILNNRGKVPFHSAILRGGRPLIRELLINGADVNAEDRYNHMMPLEELITNFKGSSTTLSGIVFLLLLFGASSSDKAEISNNSIVKGSIVVLEELKRNYPHCAKLIEASKNSDLQYNEDAKKLDKEFEDIIESYGGFVFDALRDLEKYVM